MFKTAMIASGLMFMFAGGALAADDKSKDWCNDAHMKKMEDSIDKMTDATKKKDAQTHLTQSKDAMKAKDMAACVKHMEEAHKVMGL